MSKSKYTTHECHCDHGLCCEDLNDFPAYARYYPTIERVKLAPVKHSIYHPSLTSFRRCEMDEILRKIPEEHCRHSTTNQPEEFVPKGHRMPWKPIYSFNCPSTKNLLKDKPLNLDDTDCLWVRYLDMSLEERAQIGDHFVKPLRLDCGLRMFPNKMKEPARLMGPKALKQWQIVSFRERPDIGYKMFSAAASPSWG